MASQADALRTFHAGDRAKWRRWLAKHHASSPGVWLVLDRANAAGARLSYAAAVEEALCFGWVDGRVQALNDTQYLERFTRRRPGSIWSKTNKERVDRMISEGRMTPAGMAKVEAAKRDGSWASLDDVDALAVPPDLARALRGDAAARRGFEGLSATAKKQILYWLRDAKRDETRARRIAAVLPAAAQGKTPFTPLPRHRPAAAASKDARPTTRRRKPT
jgi:uncharacterized protein YdeI (YjbR/CyaY-like superfamily)